MMYDYKALERTIVMDTVRSFNGLVLSLSTFIDHFRCHTT